MSERYGAPGELKEILEDFEDWVREEIDKSVKELERPDSLGVPRYTAGRLVAFKDVLSWLGVDR